MPQVAALLAALPFEAGLRVQWAAHALHWALAAKSPHLAARSHQVAVISRLLFLRKDFLSSAARQCRLPGHRQLSLSMSLQLSLYNASPLDLHLRLPIKSGNALPCGLVNRCTGRCGRRWSRGRARGCWRRWRRGCGRPPRRCQTSWSPSTSSSPWGCVASLLILL